MWAIRRQHYAPHIKDIVQALNICSYNPRLSSGTHLCFGRKGSLRICVAGPKTGLFFDFENGAGGTILDLIRRQLGCSWLEARNFADAFTSTESALLGKEVTSRCDDDFETSGDALKTLLYHSTPLVDDHIGTTYLRQKRKIDTQRFRMYKDIRTIPAHVLPGQDRPALFCCARSANSDYDEDITGGQVIFLNKNGEKAPDQFTQKKSIGKIKGSYVCAQRVPRGNEQSGIVLLAEGVETALSIASSFPDKVNVFASLGLFNFKNFQDFAADDKRISTVIICEDNDSTNNSSTTKDAENILKRDFQVERVKPELDGYDFNDVLKKGGPKDVRECFSHIPGMEDIIFSCNE